VSENAFEDRLDDVPEQKRVVGIVHEAARGDPDKSPHAGRFHGSEDVADSRRVDGGGLAAEADPSAEIAVSFPTIAERMESGSITSPRGPSSFS